ncbi:hypothetical protein BC351_00670 [Paenibacillus ferrarius]|uniref:Uncharacterized protein n=1 Tax=Paenibacillus ferrarius TaxID=1469647 RepID=A0A1V4HSD9_9BACL|nr:hypothetical protein [Paenibacillus ferrarius]OPH61786.1 hypothetical protein BC351_00670 [Paenibacillus ferrarius]
MKYEDQFKETDKVQIKTALGKLFKGEVEKIVFKGDAPIGFWWHDKEAGLDEFIAFEEVETVDVVELTKLEKELYLTLGENYEELENLADEYKTNPQEIVIAFIHDLIMSNSSGGSDERDAASSWFRRNCISGEFVR